MSLAFAVFIEFIVIYIFFFSKLLARKVRAMNLFRREYWIKIKFNILLIVYLLDKIKFRFIRYEVGINVGLTKNLILHRVFYFLV